jgi:prophage antirepressor-like protein
MNKLLLIKSSNFGNVQCDFWEDDNGEILMTREQIGLALEYTDPMVAIGKIHDRHKERLEKYSFTILVNGRNTYFYTAKGVYEICRFSQQPKADAFMDWVWDVIESIRKTGTYSIQPITPIQALQQAVNILAEQEKRLKAAEEKMQVLQYRVENLDATNIDGDLQQRLNKLVRKYAFKNGIMHNIAWEHFKQAYNTAYRTNLELLINNYSEREGVKKLTIPQYLAVTGKLEDALRVADKMINGMVREA